MRHYEIGKLELSNSKWYLSFFKNKLKKTFSNYEDAYYFANKELKKFVDYANEGATYRIIQNGKIIFHQNDIEKNGYEEYNVTYDEYFYTHFFYASQEDKALIGKVNGEVTRNAQQENWYQEEVEKSNLIKKYSKDQIEKKAQEIILEMTDKLNEYIKAKIAKK